MQKIYLNGVAPGAVIAQDLYGNDGVLLIKKGTAFREQFTPRFQEAGIKEIYIEANGEMSPASNERIRTSLNLQDIIHEKTRSHAHAHIRKTMLRLKSMTNEDVHRISQIIDEMIEQLLEQKDFVFALSQLRSVDDYTYHHSVNVGVLSLMIGIDLNLTKEQLQQLGIGAILHDIGKIMISEDIIKKPAKLTPAEYEEVKKHTVYGYEILRQTNMSEESALIALHHHEKFDGSGYCYGLQKTKIPLFARIVAVADVYDAMSHDRVYQKKSNPDRVYREITHLGEKHFDTRIMETFARHICIYPTGTGIILNSGHRGIVLHQNKLYPESPIVRIFTPHEKDIKRLYLDIDLSINTDFRIIDTY